MREIIWLIGKTCVGKTTWAKENFHTHSTGEEARKELGAEKMSEDENPTTPAEYEHKVRAAVRKKVLHFQNSLSMQKVQTLVIDSFPRSRDQVEFLQGVMFDTPCLQHRVIYASCPGPEREKRIASRAEKDEQDRKLIEARLKEEDAVFLGVLEELVQRGVPVESLVLYGQKTPRHFDPRVRTDLAVIFEDHKQVFEQGLKKFGIRADAALSAGRQDKLDSYSDNAVWMRRFIRKLIEEGEELLDESPEKWWSTDGTDMRACRVELIDMFHFMLSASIVMGMDAGEFVDTYNAKRRINLARWSAGYSAKNKAGKDDEHIGRIEPLDDYSNRTVDR